MAEKNLGSELVPDTQTGHQDELGAVTGPNPTRKEMGNTEPYMSDAARAALMEGTGQIVILETESGDALTTKSERSKSNNSNTA
ncbi:hypothetical protein COU91_03200 [Candidatus Saccharibacteria bacterium CG10_big_fil_rev_8_21_14_0_10_47_8]|nr:MAG: hypothetical protein COU91_03200 [Candidatus Saccharibacteria bacterium CG10_big_fil_rev_8_21_14_0_10_47_8]